MVYRIPDNIAWIDGADIGMDEELYLTIVPDGETVMLEDTARLIWLVAIRGGDVVTGVSELVGLRLTETAEEIRKFLTDLTHRGFLRKE